VRTTLWQRLDEYASQVFDTGDGRAAEFDLRRKVVDDIEQVFVRAGAFRKGSCPVCDGVRTRRVAEDLADYMLKGRL